MHAVTSPSADTPLALVELPSPALGNEDVRVAVRAIGVNPVDWKMRSGGPLRFMQRLVGPSGPLVVGVDFAGEVVEVGAAVKDLAVGARVVGGTDFSRKQRGSYADEVVVRPDQCAILPADVTFERAASLPVAAVTAWMMLTEHAGIRAGDKVLVLGASGGVGLFAIALARKLGASVVGVCGSKNVAVVEQHGAIAVDYTQGDALEAARPHGPFDLVLNAVDSKAYPTARCRTLLSDKGIVDIAVPGPGDYLALAFSPRVKTVLGKPTRERLEPLVDALAKGELEPIIAARFPLAEAERAHEMSRGGKVVGKILLAP